MSNQISDLRLLITGSTRSGKSTSIHAFLADALRRPWLKIILLDGKGTELLPYQHLKASNALPITYHGPNQLDRWETALDAVATGLTTRFAKLTTQGLRAAAPGDPALLIVIDEVQVGCRDKSHGRAIKQHLTRIAEQSAALGDVLVMTCQRAQNSVPPSVRINCNAKLAMLGEGFFLYQPEGRPNNSGRLTYTTPQDVLNTLSTPLISASAETAANLAIRQDSLLQILGANRQADAEERANATLYLGEIGSGRTYQLQHHQAPRAQRTVYVDLNESHKSWLTSILEQCGAALPTRANLTQVANMAALALQAAPTLLLLDNIDKASEKARPSINKMLQAAYRVAMSATPPQTEAQKRKVNPFIPRCDVIRIAPLLYQESLALTCQQLPPNIDRREAIKQRIARMGAGHPATIVALCHQAKKGTLTELRKMETASKSYSLVWVVLVVLIASFIVLRYQYDSYVATFVLIMMTVIFRPLFYRAIRGQN